MDFKLLRKGTSKESKLEESFFQKKHTYIKFSVLKINKIYSEYLIFTREKKRYWYNQRR